MSVVKLGIDLGCENTSIYMINKGVVLCEPSLILYKNGNIHSVGKKSELYLTQQSEKENDVEVVKPIKFGKVVDTQACASMLHVFLTKIIEDSSVRIVALISIPCGLTEAERKVFQNVAFKAGISSVFFIPNVIASFYSNENLKEAGCGLVADLGSQCCDLACVNGFDIVEGATINFDSSFIDKAIVKMVECKYEVKITQEIAKYLKESISTLNFKDKTDKLIIALSYNNEQPVKIRVNSIDVSGVVKNFYDLIIEELKVIIDDSELKEPNLNYNNLFVSGGGATIENLSNYLQQNLNLSVECGNGLSLVQGLGQILENEELFKRIIKKK